MESELFGHEKGAFTGAGAQRKGRFELAHGSTLMLDEVGDIPLELQPKLLRVLQAREIERLGGHKVISVDVRLVAATNRNLQEMVLDGTFRDDLFYRLNVFPIAIPPLRERREDIPLLAKHFTQQMARQMKKNITNIPSAALRLLCDQPWPGNVRELANVIERAVILSSGPSLNICPLEVPAPVAAISQRKQEASAPPAPAQPIRPVYTDAHHQPGETLSERDRIVAAILACNGVMAGSRGVAAMRPQAHNPALAHAAHGHRHQGRAGNTRSIPASLDFASIPLPGCPASQRLPCSNPLPLANLTQDFRPI